MSSLRFHEYSMPSASLGKLNPLPDIKQTMDHHASIAIDESTVTKEEAKYMGWGKVQGILPYLIQDGYNRKKKPRAWKSAVLENDFIRATFLPELGGRLWSLIDKTTGKELLHCNPVFQPCNLALRNAWISGGVEWNIGMIGHTPFTVDKMYTQRLSLSDGTPVLRMYQYERVRRLVYRVEAMLPEDSHQLYVRVRIDNTSKQDTAVYWWSNMAVDEREDVRVVVPSTKTFRYGYGGKLSKVNVPYMTVEAKKLKGNHGLTGNLHWDISRTTELPQAMDFFFDLPTGQRRWIAAIGGDGYGFAQTSTDILRGRKLFVWGMGGGGRNWQSFLAKPGCAYLEIQAGLARTQLEHLPMAGGETISWMEAYGPVRADPMAVHGKDWDESIQTVERALEATCPRTTVENMLSMVERELDGKNGKIMQQGAGWACVQKELLKEDFSDGGLYFSARSIGKLQRPWMKLLQKGYLPCPDPLTEPQSYQIGAEWEEVMQKNIAEGGSDHWYGHYQYGVTLAHAGKLSLAEQAFDASLAHTANPWAMRCKAVLCQMQGDLSMAVMWLKQAVVLLPEQNIAKETLEALSKADQPEEVVRIYGTLPIKVKTLGRLKVLLIEALLELGDVARAERMLSGSIELTDVREGEVKLTDLWFRMCAMKRSKESGEALDDALLASVKLTCVPPAHLDFRMN